MQSEEEMASREQACLEEIHLVLVKHRCTLSVDTQREGRVVILSPTVVAYERAG